MTNERNNKLTNIKKYKHYEKMFKEHSLTIKEIEDKSIMLKENMISILKAETSKNIKYYNDALKEIIVARRVIIWA